VLHCLVLWQVTGNYKCKAVYCTNMTSQNIQNTEAGDVVGIEYEPVHGNIGGTKSVVLTVVENEWQPVAKDDEGNKYTLKTEGGDAIEIAKHDSHDNPRRNGWVKQVTRIGWA